jgi:hypothetical protein
MAGMITTATPKDSLVRLSLDEIQPSSVNDLVYRPVRRDDPSIIELAKSIRDIGLQQPILVTKDKFILSGHRRYAACRLAGLTEVPCQIMEISRFDPGFEKVLVECNRQRVKDFAEVVREKIVTHNPAEAHGRLRAHRRAKSAVNGDCLKIEGMKTRKRISGAKQPMLMAVKNIISRRRKYWPLSDRSIHYDLLNDPPLRHAKKPDSVYQNKRESYQDLCDLLTRARITGAIPFAAIADPTRPVVTWDVFSDVGGFVQRELDWFLDGYQRNLQRSQPNHIEIVGEKNTIEGSIRAVAQEYCIPYTLGRGYSSLDPRHQLYQRYKKSGKDKLVLLILSDFDAEGEDIAHSFARSMRDDFGIAKIHALKVCLTYDQVLERDIPQTFDIKKSSARYKRFAAKYGDRAHEIEALEPDERAQLLEEAILEVMDVDAYNAEVDAEAEDAARLEVLREAVGPMLMKALNEGGLSS